MNSASGIDGALESSWKGWPASACGRVEPVQGPIAGPDGVLLVRHRLGHVDAVGDAGRVGDDRAMCRDRPRPRAEPWSPACRWPRSRSGRRTRCRKSEPPHRGPSSPTPCRRRRTSPLRPAAWPWRPGHRCSSTPRCRARGCSRRGRRTGRGRGRRSRCRRPSRRRRRSRRSCGQGRWSGRRRWRAAKATSASGELTSLSSSALEPDHPGPLGEHAFLV